jgi:hypothetical protein
MLLPLTLAKNVDEEKTTCENSPWTLILLMQDNNEESYNTTTRKKECKITKMGME